MEKGNVTVRMMADRKGLFQCLRYSFAPNRLHYCGPEKQLDLAGYLRHHTTDQGLVEILDQFDTLYKYLVLIASQNNIPDPFDQRVVEAYWVGNSLLTQVGKYALAHHLTDSLELKKKVPVKKFHPMIHAVVDGGVPHHTVHVLGIFNRTGHHAVPHTLHTMDECRISWGKVISIAHGNNSNSGTYVVKVRPLLYRNTKLMLGVPIEKIATSIDATPRIDDWVSIHWSTICEVLSNYNRRQLARYTNVALTNANSLDQFSKL